jgi:hypothetical protein
MGSISFIQDDGGRAAAGFTGTAGDCVVRAVAIASGRLYKEIHNELSEWQGYDADAGGNTTGHYTYKRFIENLGFKWIPVMHVGSGCKMHLRAGELPMGRIIVRASVHVVAVIDGVIHDTHDCSRGGKRCVYGYFTKEI